MTPSRKIQVRPKKEITIRVSEKPSYVCRKCSNRYHSLFNFCPQCLGVVLPAFRRSANLKIVSIARSEEGDLADILRRLSGKKDFDFEKALRIIPWTLIQDTDASILQHWKDVID